MRRSGSQPPSDPDGIKVNKMSTPTTRGEFERHLFLLTERFRQDKINIPRTVAGSMLRMRYLPNGRIDFLSVDESARLLANMMAQPDEEVVDPIPVGTVADIYDATFERSSKDTEMVLATGDKQAEGDGPSRARRNSVRPKRSRRK